MQKKGVGKETEWMWLGKQAITVEMLSLRHQEKLSSDIQFAPDWPAFAVTVSHRHQQNQNLFIRSRVRNLTELNDVHCNRTYLYIGWYRAGPVFFSPILVSQLP